MCPCHEVIFAQKHMVGCRVVILLIAMFSQPMHVASFLCRGLLALGRLARLARQPGHASGVCGCPWQSEMAAGRQTGCRARGLVNSEQTLGERRWSGRKHHQMQYTDLERDLDAHATKLWMDWMDMDGLTKLTLARTGGLVQPRPLRFFADGEKNGGA